jgi:hypothetical protein
VLVDDFVDFGHEAEGFAEGDDVLVLVTQAIFRKIFSEVAARQQNVTKIPQCRLVQQSFYYASV